VGVVKIRRLGWSGQIAGVEEERIAGNVLNGKFHIARSLGKTRTKQDGKHYRS
jgi:hypothetical protein